MFTPSGIFTLETEQNKIRVNEPLRAHEIAAVLSATDEEIDASILYGSPIPYVRVATQP